MSTTALRTENGSWYTVQQQGERWFMCAANVPNPESGRLPGDAVWEIQPPRPWPPVLGQRIWLLSVHFNQPDHPERMPGGGKITSYIVEVRGCVSDEAIGSTIGGGLGDEGLFSES